MDLSLNIITRSLTIPLNYFAIAVLLSACSILVLVMNESRMAYQVNMLISLGLYTIFDCSFYTPIDPVDKRVRLSLLPKLLYSGVDNNIPFSSLFRSTLYIRGT